MATQEKLLKSIQNLQTLITSNQLDVAARYKGHKSIKQIFKTKLYIYRKKEKIQHCNFITEAMSNSTVKIAQNFSTLLTSTIEMFLKLIDDPDADVRMVADESLNRIIKVKKNYYIQYISLTLMYIVGNE